MILELPYGRGLQSAVLPDLDGRATDAPVGPSERDPAAVVAGALDAPLAMEPLAACARGARRVSVLVSGEDRVAGAPLYMPVLLNRLAQAGVRDDQVEVVCATGTHARHSPETVRGLLGEEAARRVRLRPHDCDGAAFVAVGTTSRGTPVRLDRRVCEADLRILTGRVTHHYFAGFSGGRKSILPGVAARATIVANHRRVLDFAGNGQVNGGTFGGNLVGNPVHEDMVEAARMVGPCFVLNTVLDREQRLCHAFAGELEQAHLAACRMVDGTCFFPVEEPADLVVASAGGHPCDLNFIQSVKALFNHREAVRPGGVFVMVAEAAGGILSGMTRWMCWPDRASLGSAMEASYDLAAHNSLMLRDLLSTVTVILVSALPPADVRVLGLVPARDLHQALSFAFDRLGPRPVIRVVPHGNVTWSGRRRGRIGMAPAPARPSQGDASRAS